MIYDCWLFSLVLVQKAYIIYVIKILYRYGLFYHIIYKGTSEQHIIIHNE